MKINKEYLEEKLNSKILKRFKFAILFIFLALVAIDVVLVNPNGFPTISQVIYDSSPKYIILVWLMGLFITNVFFQRSTKKPVNLKKNLLILGFSGVVILGLGFTLKQPTHLNCDNYKTEMANVPIPLISRVVCQDYTNGLSEYENRDCLNMDCSNNIHFKHDFTVGFKFFILLVGILLGYFLWPYLPQNNP